MTPSSLTRRGFLRAAGVSLALPAFESMLPRAVAGKPPVPRRLVAVNVGLGLYGPAFFPEKPGRDYVLSPYLQELAAHREDFTVFSGVSHPDVDGGHSAEYCFLTAVPHPGLPTFRNGISLDQLAAEKCSGQTRFDSLCLSTGGGGLSWSRNGVRLPTADKPSAVFAKLFLKGSEKEVKAQMDRLRKGKSILDAVRGQVRELEGGFGAGDREKLDEYLTAVRECEQQLARARAWMDRPKPTVSVPPPQDITNHADVIGRCRLMYDLMHLAIQTDSTRFLTFAIDGPGETPVGIPGVDAGYHALSHHGLDPKRIDQLRRVELELIKVFRDFLTKLKNSREGGETLLDRTAVILGSNLGNASSHDNRNLPVLLAGGRFRHGQHLASDTRKNQPLCNVFVSVLQHLGLEIEKFGSSTGTMTGLEIRPAG